MVCAVNNQPLGNTESAPWKIRREETSKPLGIQHTPGLCGGQLSNISTVWKLDPTRDNTGCISEDMYSLIKKRGGPNPNVFTSGPPPFELNKEAFLSSCNWTWFAILLRYENKTWNLPDNIIFLHGSPTLVSWWGLFYSHAITCHHRASLI